MEKRERQTYRVEGIMSEKRFSLEYYDNMSYVKDNSNDNEYYLYWAVELMNELYEENE